MSQENVEIVRAANEAWNAGDMDALRELYDPGAIVRTPDGWPEPGPYSGREAVMRWFEQLRETWDAAGVKPADVQSMDDFHEKVPFLDKDAIRDFRDRHHDPYGGMLCLDPKMTEVFSAIFSTSGTTGDPTPAPYAGRGPSMLVRTGISHSVHTITRALNPMRTKPSVYISCG